MTLEAIEAFFRDLTEDKAAAPAPQGTDPGEKIDPDEVELLDLLNRPAPRVLQPALTALQTLVREFIEDGTAAPKPMSVQATAQAAERLQKEQALLRTYFPSFRIQCADDPERAGAVGTLTTNSGREYGLWIALGAFPNEPPGMFVVSPKNLRNRRGKKLAKVGINSTMHLLSPDEHGHPQICHHDDTSWTPNITLYKVAMKGRLWLEAYEMHMATGKDIDHYLPHM